MATSFSGGRSPNTRREPPTMGKQLVSFILVFVVLISSLIIMFKIILKRCGNTYDVMISTSKSERGPGGSMS
jgi:uncharacterized membrane protein